MNILLPQFKIKCNYPNYKLDFMFHLQMLSVKLIKQKNHLDYNLWKSKLQYNLKYFQQQFFIPCSSLSRLDVCSSPNSTDYLLQFKRENVNTDLMVKVQFFHALKKSIKCYICNSLVPGVHRRSHMLKQIWNWKVKVFFKCVGPFIEHGELK